MHDIFYTLGKRISTLRKQKKMSQEELAERCEKMVNTISNVERGLSNPRLETLVAIAQALDVSMADLFSENIPISDGRVVSDKLLEIVMCLKNEDERVLEVVLKQIKALRELKN